jgi:predicted neuraminidase
MKNLDYGMTIGTAVTHKGRLFACWVGGGDNPKAFFLLSYSDDKARSWREPVLVIDPHDKKLPCDRCTIVGTLWVDPLNRLWLFFNQTLGHFDGRSSNWYIRCDDPDAQKLKWTEPHYIWHGCTLNKPIVLKNGEWLLPVSLWARKHISHPFDDCYHELDDQRMAHLFVSFDKGETWTRRGSVIFPDSQFDEHMVVQLKDGRLWMLARTDTFLMESFSGDDGATWSKPERARVQSVNARFHIRCLHSGRILLIKHGKMVEQAPENRSWLTAFLSEDEADTWSKGFVLDERYEVSYPDSDQGADGIIYVTYDRNRAKDGEILMASLREEDILEGRIHTPDAFVRRVILRPGRLGRLSKER